MPIVGNPSAIKNSGRRDNKKVNLNTTLDAAAQRQYLHNDLFSPGAKMNQTNLDNSFAPHVNTDINKYSTIGPDESLVHRKMPNTMKGGYRSTVGTDQF